MGELYPRHEKQTKNPAETTGNRYKIEILMSRTQKLKGLSAASLRLKTLNDNPYAKQQAQAESCGGEFLQLVPGGTFVSVRAFASTTGRRPKSKKLDT